MVRVVRIAQLQEGFPIQSYKVIHDGIFPLGMLYIKAINELSYTYFEYYLLKEERVIEPLNMSVIICGGVNRIGSEDHIAYFNPALPLSS